MADLGDAPPSDWSPLVGRATARWRLGALLRDAGIVGADLDARVLVCAACDIDHAALIRAPDEVLGAAAGTLASFAARRLAGEPVSRILGRREFWGLPFIVTPDVLDPRPETEGIVGSALDALGGRRATPLRVLDLGTGSGAILCALLHDLPAARGLGVDRSPAACRVAARNIAALGLAARGAIVCADWADPIVARFDLVVSNPPYVRTGEFAGLAREVRDHDPAAALDGGMDGLDAFRAIVPRLDSLLAANGIVVFECGFDEGAGVAGLMRDAGLDAVMVYRDWSGHERVVVGVKLQSVEP